MKKIKVKNLKYKYPTSKDLILKDISFDINEGEFVGIIGENTSGKSTLAQALVGLVPHFYKGSYGGEVEVSGLNIRNSDISEICIKVGMVFENPFTQITGSRLSVYEEVAFGLENLGLARGKMIKRIEYVLNLLNIYEHRDKNPFDLSGGQMQRLAIASILAMNPEVLVLDEPTSQLDPKGTEDVFRAVSNLAKEGITIVMVENDVEKIAKYCDRCLLIHDGKLIDFDTPQKIFSRNDLEDYGIAPPVYTRICKKLRKPDSNGFYPITFEETYNRLVNYSE